LFDRAWTFLCASVDCRVTGMRTPVSTQHITGPDGNRIDLFVSRPEALTDRAQTPCVLYLHGGAMVTLRADGANYRRFRHLVASRGRLTCIGVEFRNAAGALGCHPFPAALNDCMAALAWAHSHLEQLGASHVVLAGESGGANLAFASALRAKREGVLGIIAGVFGMCPYIYGDYAAPPPDLPSMVENDGYGISLEMGAARARLYDPSGEHTRDPLAWPYWATQHDLTGLPPHCVSVAELDPHRDEGVAYFRKLNEAGVDASARTVLGVNHGWEIFGLDLVAPRITLETVDHLASFAHSVGNV